MKNLFGRYQILEILGIGGMGEVALAEDLHLRRKVALKQIRHDQRKKPNALRRFLREAKIAASLCHPSIIPIYSIHEDTELPFYTMPYIEGKTLKDKLLELRKKPPSETSYVLHELLRIYLSVCQAIGYSHSHSILHRDIKPENIIIGKWGETMLIDWGLACEESSAEEDIEEEEEWLSQGEPNPEVQPEYQITRPGKVVGTLAFLAPERSEGKKASVSSDIYSLGVLLYEILTLKLPFHRKTLKEMKKLLPFETLLHPTEVAPQRDIPDSLSDLALRCLSHKPEERPQTTLEIIECVTNFLEGIPQWLFYDQLIASRPDDWGFSEAICRGGSQAITKDFEGAHWSFLQLSKRSYVGNLRLHFSLKLEKNSSGVGIWLMLSDRPLQQLSNEGLLLWFTREKLELMRSWLPVAEEAIPQGIDELDVLIEISQGVLRVFHKDQLLLRYLVYVPPLGGKIALLFDEKDFTISPIQVSLSSHSSKMSCLAIPDAFYSAGYFHEALSHYRKIASSFPGTNEEKEALFRSGLSLIEEARKCKPSEKRALLQQADDEFSKLRSTSAAPLEFIGKSLLYDAMKETKEEIKCLELALRKSLKHPLYETVKEHIGFRLEQSSKLDRNLTFEIAEVTLRLSPEFFSIIPFRLLFQKLLKSLHGFDLALFPFKYLESSATLTPAELDGLAPLFSIAFSFALGKGAILEQRFVETPLSGQHEPLLQLLSEAIFRTTGKEGLEFLLKSSSNFPSLEYPIKGIEALSMNTDMDLSSLTPSPFFLALVNSAIDLAIIGKIDLAPLKLKVFLQYLKKDKAATQSDLAKVVLFKGDLLLNEPSPPILFNHPLNHSTPLYLSMEKRLFSKAPKNEQVRDVDLLNGTADSYIHRSHTKTKEREASSKRVSLAKLWDAFQDKTLFCEWQSELKGLICYVQLYSPRPKETLSEIRKLCITLLKKGLL